MQSIVEVCVIVQSASSHRRNRAHFKGNCNEETQRSACKDMQGVLLMAYSTSCLALFFLQASITRVSLNFLQIRRSFLKASQDFDPPSQIKGFEGTQVSSDDPIVSLRDAALLQRSPRLCEYPWCAPGSLMRMTPQ